MTKSDLLKRAKSRAANLLSKVHATKFWSIDSVLAYCQGRAFDVAIETAKGFDKGKRRDAIRNGILAMINELMECAAVLDGECSSQG